MSKPKRNPPCENDIFYPKSEGSRSAHRRVVGLSKEKVYYSTGGDRNYFCQPKALLRYGFRRNEIDQLTNQKGKAV